MYINDILKNKSRLLSFEVFPPKADSDISVIYTALDKLKLLNPDFISVTYGAGGGTRKATTEIANYIEKECNIPALAHLTCVALNEDMLEGIIKEFLNNDIHNVLALRGDRPKNMSVEDFNNRQYKYASDIIPIIKRDSNICVAGACYPEKHIEAPSLNSDLDNLLLKQSKGASFFISQLFFDNNAFYNFIDKAVTKGIKVPILAGIMPIISVKQIDTTISLSGSTIPPKFQNILDKYGNNPTDMYKAGIDYAITQINELINFKVKGIHIYTMNKPDICMEIVKNILI